MHTIISAEDITFEVMMFVDFFLTIKWTYLIFNVAVLVFNFSEAYFLIERMNAWSIMLNVSNNMYWRICQCNYCLFIIDNFDYWPFEYNRASTFRTFSYLRHCHLGGKTCTACFFQVLLWYLVWSYISISPLEFVILKLKVPQKRNAYGGRYLVLSLMHIVFLILLSKEEVSMSLMVTSGRNRVYNENKLKKINLSCFPNLLKTS